MPVPEWNAEIITPESESGMPPLATNGGLGTNAQDELEVKVDGSTITVNGDGELEALGGGGGSVTDVEVNGTSVVNASGVAEVTVPAQVNADWNSSSGASEILNKPTIPSGTQLVPASTSADADKVLTVDAQGIPGWETPSGGSGNAYRITTSDTFATIWQEYMVNKKFVYYRDMSGDTVKEKQIYMVMYMDPTSASLDSGNGYLQQVWQMGSHHGLEVRQKRVYLSSSGTIPASVSFDVDVVIPNHEAAQNAGQFLTVNSSNTVAWTTINQVPSSTSSDEDKVLTVNSSGTPEWATPSGGTTYTAGNMISLANDAIAVSTTAGITDVQQVASLPANPVSTVLYLIPET